MTLGVTAVEFHQLRHDLFFGYTLEHGVYVAEAEKALLDELYLIGRGKTRLPLDDLRLTDLSLEKLLTHAVRFPPYVEQATQKLMTGA